MNSTRPGNIYADVKQRIANRFPIEALRKWAAPFVTQAEVQRQALSDAPVILNKKCCLLGFGGCARLDVYTAPGIGISKVQQHRSNPVPLVGACVENTLSGRCAIVLEKPSWESWLPEVGKEDSLLAAKLELMRPHNPGDSR